MVGRQHAAIEAYGKAVPPWRKVKLEALQANTLNNQAFALSNVGYFDRAKRLAEDALEIRKQFGNRSAIGLSLNTQALIEMQDGDLHRAEALSKLALGQFKDSGDQRGIALARLALAEIRRRPVTEELLFTVQTEKRLKQAIQDAEAASRGFEKIHEQVRQVEALIQLGCVYRDFMYMRRKLPGPETIEDLLANAEDAFLKARILAGDNNLLTLDAWVREAWMYYYLAGKYEWIDKSENSEPARDALGKVEECLTAADKWIDAHFLSHRITTLNKPPRRENSVFDVLTQMAKIELLRGQMACNRFENRRSKEELCKAAKHYTLCLEYNHYANPGISFRAMRRAKDRIYARFKKFNASEWQLVYETVSKTEKVYELTPGGSAMRGFLDQNFGLQ